MTMPKKGTRRIVVDEIAYRWLVSPNDEPGLGIIVEREQSLGQKMITWVEHENIISPDTVKKAILYALSKGWQPEKPARILEFQFKDLTEDTNDIPKLFLRKYCDRKCQYK